MAGTGMLTRFEAEALPYTQELYRIAVRLLRDERKAQDAVEATYRAAWKSFGKPPREISCKVWLWQILFNIVRKESQSWFGRLTGREDDVAGPSYPAPRAVPDGLTNSDIRTAVDQLPLPLRAVLLLVDVEDLSYSEASAVLSMSVDSVVSKLGRARGALGIQLDEMARVSIPPATSSSSHANATA